MVYDQSLADRVRPLLEARKGFEEKKMFGGIGFLIHGNICVGVWREFLIVRVGPDRYEESLRQPFVKEFDFTGKPMKGWVMVEQTGVGEDSQLAKWVRLALMFASSLPKKRSGKR